MPIHTALNIDEQEIAPSSNRSSVVSKTTEQLHFKILNETSKSYRKFNSTGPSFLIKFKSPGEEQEPNSVSQGMYYSTYELPSG